MRKFFSDIPKIRSDDIELRQLNISDVSGLIELTESEEVYRTLQTFLFEKSMTTRNTR